MELELWRSVSATSLTLLTRAIQETEVDEEQTIHVKYMNAEEALENLSKVKRGLGTNRVR